MDTFQLNILAASSAFYEGECESLVVPTPDGKCGVLAHHSNAIAAIKAINAARMALGGTGAHFVPLDKVIRTMLDTGRDMQSKYKETAQGGLAVNVVNC